MNFPALDQELNELRDTIHQAILEAPDDPTLVDVLGRIRSLETYLASERRSGASELEPGATGNDWALKQSRQAKRSYNDSRLFSRLWAALEAHRWEVVEFPVLLKWLLENNVLRLTWSWTNLQKQANALDMALTVAKHEITDGDPEHDVGEVWGWGSASFEAIEG